MRYCCLVHLNLSRYRFSSNQLKPLCSIIVLFWTFCDCKDICKDPTVQTNEEVIFESDAYKYSHFYHYSQIIRLNQTLPVDDRKFEKLVTQKEIDSKFSFQFYGVDVSKINLYTHGTITLIEQTQVASIDSYVNSRIPTESEFLDDRVTSKVTTVMHSNGKISFYYENIPKQTGKVHSILIFDGKIQCGKKDGTKRIVPGEWIKSGTLVEYEVSGDCPKHNTIKTCKDATTLKTMCMWCEIANTCITSNDMDSHEFKVNGCQNKNSPNINVSIEPSLTIQEEITSDTTKSDMGNELEITTENTETHLNMTVQITEDREYTKSRNYSYIVIPVVVSFIVVCTGCVIGLWIYRKKKALP
ncbi:unnamed protein product [Schistosoma spindalis]|nr:unnamed protein product [Schistosoma spindale]